MGTEIRLLSFENAVFSTVSLINIFGHRLYNLCGGVSTRTNIISYLVYPFLSFFVVFSCCFSVFQANFHPWITQPALKRYVFAPGASTESDMDTFQGRYHTLTCPELTAIRLQRRSKPIYSTPPAEKFFPQKRICVHSVKTLTTFPRTDRTIDQVYYLIGQIRNQTTAKSPVLWFK